MTTNAANSERNLRIARSPSRIHNEDYVSLLRSIAPAQWPVEVESPVELVNSCVLCLPHVQHRTTGDDCNLRGGSRGLGTRKTPGIGPRHRQRISGIPARLRGVAWIPGARDAEHRT